MSPAQATTTQTETTVVDDYTTTKVTQSTTTTQTSVISSTITSYTTTSTTSTSLSTALSTATTTTSVSCLPQPTICPSAAPAVITYAVEQYTTSQTAPLAGACIRIQVDQNANTVCGAGGNIITSLTGFVRFSNDMATHSVSILPRNGFSSNDNCFYPTRMGYDDLGLSFIDSAGLKINTYGNAANGVFFDYNDPNSGGLISEQVNLRYVVIGCS